MKFSLYIPVGNVTPGEFQSRAAIREMADALERANIDACCVTDHPAPSSEWPHANGHDALDPFTALAFIAAESATLQLLTNILVLPYRNPFITAKAATTLQVLSGGRLILGVGAGYQQAEFDALGVDFRKRGRLTDEALETISSTDDFANRSQAEADSFLEALDRLRAIGVNWVTLKLPHPGRAAYLDNVRWFGEQIVEQLRSR